MKNSKQRIIKKITAGLIVGLCIGLFTSSIFLLDVPVKELLLTKITATSILTGLFCGLYAHFFKSKLEIFFVSVLIGIIIFFIKYLLTGHYFDPLVMGAFTGALLGGFFVVYRKLSNSLKFYKKLEKLRKKGFNNYN